MGLWKEIASERETAYLVKSETMKNRLLAAAHRRAGIPFDSVVDKLGL
jgi:antitoxin YefM